MSQHEINCLIERYTRDLTKKEKIEFLFRMLGYYCAMMYLINREKTVQ